MFALLTRSAAIALGLALGAVSAYAQTPSSKPAAPTATATLNREDQRFIKEAGAGGLAEVELSKIAQKSGNPEVKNFADRMVQDHSKANQELVTIASSLGADVPKGAGYRASTRVAEARRPAWKGIRRGVHARDGGGSQQGGDALSSRGALRPEHRAQTIGPKNAAHSPDAPKNGPGVVA
jgi:predicted outer membrane protein